MSAAVEPDPSDLKYASGVSPGRKARRPVDLLEWATVLHVGIFFVATTWAFGGQADWVRTPLAGWGSLGVLLTVLGIFRRIRHQSTGPNPLWWLIPVILFNGLVLLGCLNPSFRAIRMDGDLAYVPDAGRPGWPTVALPSVARNLLWVFDSIWFSCFNLALIVRRRRVIRGLLILISLNVLALSIFGTVQRLTRAAGLYFGAYPSRQSHFFATFVYHNHWGAFVLLVMASSLGLVWHYARRRESRDFFHSPAFGGLAAVLIMAVTVPLSTSRSSTMLAIGLLGGAFVHWLYRLVRRRRHYRESIAPAIVAGSIALILAGAAIGFLARDTIAVRLRLTREQIDVMRAAGNVGARGVLYRNTWRMAEAKPWFGWGMGSYPYVFTLYNTQESTADRLPVFYHDAHSDWLQGFAEHGFIGSFLLALCALVPLVHGRLRALKNAISGYLIIGCCVVLLYAWLEFPFGNFAVVLTWWICFFAAVRYASLTEPRPLPAPDPIHSNA